MIFDLEEIGDSKGRIDRISRDLWSKANFWQKTDKALAIVGGLGAYSLRANV